MSDFRVLQDISLRLRTVLFSGLNGSEFTSENNISLDSPAELEGRGNRNVLLSLYLYHVLPNTHMNNYNLIPVGNDQHQYPPLSLDLFYLLTPVSNSPEENLVILGHAMQILAANPIIGANFLDSLLRPNPPEIRVTVNPVDLEELTRIWNAFNEPYRLSVCYKVQSASLDSVRTPLQEADVVEGLIDVHQIVSEPEGTS